MEAMRPVLLLVYCMSLTGCVMKEEPYRRAVESGVEKGMTEQQAVVAAGAPSRITEATDLCREGGGVREMHYDSVVVYLGGLKESNNASIVFCLDDRRTVISRIMVDY